MADSYWRCTDDGRIQPASLPPVAGKRPRTEFDVPSGHEMAGYYGRNNEQGMHHSRSTDPIETSYERYLRNGISSNAGVESARSLSSGVTSHPIDDQRAMGSVGSEPFAARSRTSIGVGGGGPEVPLPPNASSTLFVERLPANCTRREVSHVFRPFVGFKEVRLVIKDSRHPGGNPFVLCFVDFVSPAHAATAMETLQGYKFDEHDRDSDNLRLQFARHPGARSGGGHHTRH